MAAIVPPSSPANRRMIPRPDAPPAPKRFRVSPAEEHVAAAAGDYNPPNVQRRLQFGALQHPPAIGGLIQLLQVLVVNNQN